MSPDEIMRALTAAYLGKVNIDFLFSAEVIKLIEEKTITVDFVLNNMRYLEEIFSKDLFDRAYYAFKNKTIDMKLFENYKDTFCASRNHIIKFCSQDCQEAISQGYVN
jgi:hypothetical protein